MSLPSLDVDEVAKSSPGRVRRYYSTYGWIKPKLDFTLALLMLTVSAPVVVLAVILVRLGSRGPLIYKQKRVGVDGKVFTIYKIRTMYADSEHATGPRWCVPGDCRITPVGRFLRASHLDELPQLINVLRGDMSLIGPRPERPEFVDQLERVLPNYRTRLQVRPGLTGLAQVLQPPDTDIFSVRRKLIYDLYYVANMSPWLDSRLILGTVFKCLGIPFVWIGRILRLPDPTGRIARGSRVAEPEFAPSSLVPNSYIP
jgi:lipopolysaccharide/colanic/teichoic acid biosynthesis glycosyltransferase